MCISYCTLLQHKQYLVDLINDARLTAGFSLLFVLESNLHDVILVPDETSVAFKTSFMSFLRYLPLLTLVEKGNIYLLHHIPKSFKLSIDFMYGDEPFHLSCECSQTLSLNFY